MPDSTYHQIHFAWAEPTLLGRTGPGPAASSFSESDQPVLRSWRDRLVPALTADYRSALPSTDPSDYPETLWAHSYPDGQAALVYRWPGDVRSAHAWAIVGPSYGLTLPRVLSLHENPHSRPAERRPPKPGWETMDTLPTPEPWERTAAPGAVRTRDRRAAETSVDGEPILVGAVASALCRPDLPVHIALASERADLWQAVQMRFLWGVHRILHDVLTPPRAIPAAGWAWSFSTYDPVLGTADGQHLAFGPPPAGLATPFLNPPPTDFLTVAEGLVAVLRDEGGDALAAHLRERGVPDAPTFADRRDILCDWLDPRARPLPPEPDDVPAPEELPADLPELREVDEPGDGEDGEDGEEGGPAEEAERPPEATVPEGPAATVEGPAPPATPDTRTPADAPPLAVVEEAAPDYAVETEPDPAQASREEAAEDNWPTQYVDLPLSRLERWHSKRGPEGARADIADVRAAVRAERAELQRVRDERDHYHTEVQDLRREVARLDRPWLDTDEEEAPAEARPRRWPARVLVLILLAAFLATGLEAGARFDMGTTDLLGRVWAALPLSG